MVINVLVIILMIQKLEKELFISVKEEFMKEISKKDY
jgi:hypothetical protein